MKSNNLFRENCNLIPSFEVFCTTFKTRIQVSFYDAQSIIYIRSLFAVQAHLEWI